MPLQVVPEMGYYLPETAPEKSDPTAKNRVWGFFAESLSVCLETRPAVLEVSQENYGGPQETASGIPYWPSRDPIGEEGGMNLYGFVLNSPQQRIDVLGREPLPTVGVPPGYPDVGGGLGPTIPLNNLELPTPLGNTGRGVCSRYKTGDGDELNVCLVVTEDGCANFLGLDCNGELSVSLSFGYYLRAGTNDQGAISHANGVGSAYTGIVPLPPTGKPRSRLPGQMPIDITFLGYNDDVSGGVKREGQLGSIHLGNVECCGDFESGIAEIHMGTGDSAIGIGAIPNSINIHAYTIHWSVSVKSCGDIGGSSVTMENAIPPLSSPTGDPSITGSDFVNQSK